MYLFCVCIHFIKYQTDKSSRLQKDSVDQVDVLYKPLDKSNFVIYTEPTLSVKKIIKI